MRREALSRYVLYSPEAGVYLGNAMGLGFWSKWDPVGQDAAVTFASEADAIAHVASWDPSAFDIAVIVKRIECAGPPEQDGVVFATIDECTAADLPPWDPSGPRSGSCMKKRIDAVP